MKHLLRPLVAGAFVLVIAAAPALTSPQQQVQSQSQQQGQPPAQTGQSTQATPPCKTDQTTQQTPPPTDSTQSSQAAQPCPPAAKPKTNEPGHDAPITQQTEPNVKAGSKQDVEAIGNRNVGKGMNLYSIEKEIALGKSLAQQVEQTSKMIDDPIIVEYVNRVGQNLVRNSDSRVPFTIKVIDSDAVNAFALPGGFFYVNSGLILRAHEEAELAGVMAHEIAHVAARHGTKNATKGELMQLAMIPIMLLGPGGWAGYGIYEAAQFAIPLGYLKFSRDAEREADYLGLQYMYKAGYDPNAYITFFERILAEERRSPGTIPKLFNDHPPTPERIGKTQAEIAAILPSRDNYIVTTSEFDAVKARLIAFERRNKPAGGKDSGTPTLRSKTEQAKDKNGKTQDGGDDSDRPVLKKRDGTGPDHN
jgi:predicted Zn-dependent protease